MSSAFEPSVAHSEMKAALDAEGARERAVAIAVSTRDSTDVLQTWRWSAAHFLRPNDVISIIHVVPTAMEGISSIMEPTVAYEIGAKKCEWLPNEMRDGVKALSSSPRARYFEVKPAFGVSPAQALVDFVNLPELKPDVLIMGTRGLGSLKTTVMGSFSEHVAAYAEVPVVVVRGTAFAEQKGLPAGSQPGGAVSPLRRVAGRKIAFALDGSDTNTLLMRWACANLIEPKDRVLLLHSPHSLDEEQEALAANKITDAAYVVRAMLNLGGTAQGEATDARISSIKLDKHKDVRYELVTHAEDERADLLVTGAARLGTFMAAATALAGRRSVSYHMLNNAPCPVLVVANPTLLQWSVHGPPAQSVVRKVPETSSGSFSSSQEQQGRVGEQQAMETLSLGGVAAEGAETIGTPASKGEKRPGAPAVMTAGA